MPPRAKKAKPEPPPVPEPDPRSRVLDVQKLVVDAVSVGNTLPEAARYAGLDRRSLTRYMQRGRIVRDLIDNDQPVPDHEWAYLTFLEAVERAESAAVVRNIDIINRSAQSGNWQAAAWFLERRRPQDYGRRTLEISGPSGGPIPVSVDDAMKALEEVLEGMGVGSDTAGDPESPPA